MNNEFLKLHAKNGNGTVDIAIVGAGERALSYRLSCTMP